MHSNNLKIQLKDFPDDIYILLEGEFRAKFFKTAWKINRSYRHLAKKLGISNTTTLSFRRGKDPAELEKSISIKHLKQIIEFSQDSPLWCFNWEDIQNNIKSIRARAGTHKIYDIKLPIKDSIYLREIVTHLLCDGSALSEKKRTSKYALTNLEAVNEFKKELSIFGKMPNMKIHKRVYPNHYHDCHVLVFSKAITKILTNKFNINFRSSKARIPQEFFEGNRKLLIAIIRAFLIDEGCINDRNIIFCSGNVELLEDLNLICNKLGYKCQKIRQKNRTFYLQISPDSFKKVYDDIMSIYPLPIKEKQKRLELAVKILENKPNFRDLNKNIIELLRKSSKTTFELSDQLSINGKTIAERLNKLEKSNIVKKSEVRNLGKGGAYKWAITD